MSSAIPLSPRSSRALRRLRSKGRLLAGALELDHLTGVGGDEVHVDLGMAVLGIIQVKQRIAVDNAHGDGSHLPDKRDALDLARLDPHGEGVVQRHPGAGDARCTRAAIGPESHRSRR